MDGGYTAIACGGGACRLNRDSFRVVECVCVYVCVYEHGINRVIGKWNRPGITICGAKQKNSVGRTSIEVLRYIIIH